MNPHRRSPLQQVSGTTPTPTGSKKCGCVPIHAISGCARPRSIGQHQQSVVEFRRTHTHTHTHTKFLGHFRALTTHTDTLKVTLTHKKRPTHKITQPRNRTHTQKCTHKKHHTKTQTVGFSNTNPPWGNIC
jgi:hypothetical protein